MSDVTTVVCVGDRLRIEFGRQMVPVAGRTVRMMFDGVEVDGLTDVGIDANTDDIVRRWAVFDVTKEPCATAVRYLRGHGWCVIVDATRPDLGSRVWDSKDKHEDWTARAWASWFHGADATMKKQGTR